MKVIFVSTKHYPGICAVGEHGKCAGLWDFKHLEDITDKLDADIVICGAYHPNYEKLEVTGKKIISFHSAPFEMEQTGGIEFQQLSRIMQLKKEGKIYEAIALNKDISKVFDIPYFPHPVNTNIKPIKGIKQDAIGFFVPGKFSKNITTNLMAVKLIQKDINTRLYTNLKTNKSLMDWLKLDYNLTDWIPDKNEYFKFISKMNCMLHCSWSESFGYGIIEPALLGIPVITSYNIPWVADCDEEHIHNFHIENVNSPLAIFRRYRSLRLDFGIYGELMRNSILDLGYKYNLEIKCILEEL